MFISLNNKNNFIMRNYNELNRIGISIEKNNVKALNYFWVMRIFYQVKLW